MIDLKDTTIVVVVTNEQSYRTIDQIPTVGDTVIIDCSNGTLDRNGMNASVDIVVDGGGDNRTPQDALNHAVWNATKKGVMIFVPVNTTGSVKDAITDLLIHSKENTVSTKDGIVLVNASEEIFNEAYFDKDVPITYMFSCYMALLESSHGMNIEGFVRMNVDEANYVASYKKSLAAQARSDAKVTFIIPAKAGGSLAKSIQSEYSAAEVISMSVGPKTMCKKIHKAVSAASGERIVLVSPKSTIPVAQLRTLTDDTGDTAIINEGSEPIAIAFNKESYKMFNQSPTTGFGTIVDRIKLSSIATGKKRKTNTSKTIAKARAEQIEMDVLRRESSTKDSSKKTWIIVIPYMGNGDRYPLLKKTIESLKKALDAESLSYSITVHEIGQERTLTSGFIDDTGIDHIFTEWDDVFHRGWALNVGARYSIKQDNTEVTYVFMDGDIIVTREWAVELKHTSKACVGWGVLHNLTKADTDKFLSDEIAESDLGHLKYEKTRTPAIKAAAGGITIVPKRVFDSVKGFPENFKGTWGGNDNSMMHKLDKMGHRFSMMPVTAYHLHHEHQTKRVQTIKNKWKEIKGWNRSDWEAEIESISSWGIGKTVTIAMINFKREEKLIRTLNTIADVTDMPLNISLQVQDSENISDATAERITTAVERISQDANIVWSDGNLGTGVPRWNTTTSAAETGSDYVLILDSDMILKRSTIERLLKEIEQRPEYGAVSCWCLPNYNAWDIVDNKLKHRKPKEGFNDTDALGTGCVIVRSEVFDEAQFNQDLFIGFIDFLWCMEVTSAGWKLGILAEPEFRILNDRKGDDKEYKKSRNNRDEIERSRKYFSAKWGIKV